MAYLLIRHGVKDYAKWKPFFDKDGKRRQASGSNGGMVFRNADDKHELFVLLKFPNAASARRFTHQDISDILKKSGVMGKPKLYFLEENFKFSH